MNQVVLMGRLTADPELRVTQSDISVTSFSIAVDRRFTKDDGDREADFITIQAWRKTAEMICRYFCKGKPIIVKGRIQTRSWIDQTNTKRYATEVVADMVHFVLSDNTQQERQGEPQQAPYNSLNKALESQSVVQDDLDYDDQLPF